MKSFIVLFCVFSAVTIARSQDTALADERRNIIKVDVTSPFFYRKALILSYERTLKSNQSFSITLGYQEFPGTGRLGDNVEVKEDRDRNGSKFGGEYRFYLKKENKYQAPRGIYLGPFITVHNFNNERVIAVENDGVVEEAVLNSRLGIVNIGAQLGYQFVLNNRWTIDFVFVGPAISNYRYNLKIDSSATFDKEDIQNEIILDLIERFPLLDKAISEREATTSGSLNHWSLGYRYQFQVGYFFGR